MKLHRIRCANINSLYGEHVIDLDAHLAGAPLFLIHGPTGSGKSSLMDAVSLALFGRTPRLGNEHGKDDTDPRGVMSWGTGECFAEVEFSKLGTNGTRQRYRARWTCWRARRQVEGTLQNAERSIELRQADGAWEVLYSGNQVNPAARAFDGVLEGFGVADFQRSMLLAQGQFDALLSAEIKDRAAILERLTRTERYQKIGSRAARLAKAHKDRIDTMEAAWRHVGAVEPSLMAQKEQEEADRRREAGERKAALETLRAFERWAVERTRVADELEKAGAVQQTLVLRREGLSADLAALAEHERRRPAFVLVDGIRESVRAIRESERAIAELEATLKDLDAEVTRTEGARDQVRSRRDEAVRHSDALRAAASTARAAFDRQTAAQEEVARAAESVEKARSAVHEATESHDKATRAFAEAGARVARAEHARAEHAHLEPLAREWDTLRGRLDDVVRRDGEIAKEAKRIAKDRETLERDRKAAGEAGHALVALETASVAPVRRALADATGALAALLEPDTLEARRAALSLEREQAERRIAVLEKLARALRQVELTSAKVATRTKDRDAAQLAMSAVAAVVATAEAEAHARLEEIRGLREVHEGLVRVAAVAVHRAALVDGTPCPLCGATTHPWADDPTRAPDDEQIAAEEKRSKRTLAAAEKRAAQAETAAGEAREQLSRAKERHTNAETELEAARAEATAAAGERDAVLPASGLPVGSNVRECDDAIAAETLRRDGAASRMRAIDDADTLKRRCAAEAEKREDELRKRAQSLEKRQVEIETRGVGLADDARRHQEARADLARDTADVHANLRTLVVDLPSGSPTEWKQAAQMAVDTWNAVVAEVTAATADLPIATTKLDAAGEAVSLRQGALKNTSEDHAARVDDAKQAATAAAEAQSALVAVWRAAEAADLPGDQWKRPIDDSAPEDLVASQAGVVEALEAALAVAGSLLEARRTEAGVARGKLLQRRDNLNGARRTFEEQRQSLCAETARLGIGDVTGLESCRLAPERYDAMSAARRDLENDEREARTRMEERSNALEGVLKRQPQGLPENATPESLAQSISIADAEIATASAALEEARKQVVLLKEQERRGREARQAWEEAITRGRVWLKLHELIGVNDGARFKEFAQSLNLDRLILKANVHMSRLYPRYRLSQVVRDGFPTLEFAVVDLWQVSSARAARGQQGRERSPRTLSGGERFLVSLALALGLSDLRTSTLPVETLLLDEGFGSLDPTALDMALAALQQLQADGRQVGVISHVAGLRERIPAQVIVEALGGGRSRVQVSRR